MDYLNNFISIRDIEKICANNYLTEYLKTLTHEQLMSIKMTLLCDDIVGVRIKILSAVNDELEYRFLEKFMDMKDAKFISDEFDLKLNVANYAEIKHSFEILENIGDFKKIIKWCPSLLFLEKTYKVYSFLKSNGKSDEDIVNFICSSFERTMDVANAISKEDISYQYYNEFEHLISKISERIMNKKSGTESYDKYTDKLFKENEELLKRLS